MEPIFERRQQLTGKRDYIREILESGAKKASEVAGETMELVREAMNLTL
jgi:hypothetical protein